MMVRKKEKLGGKEIEKTKDQERKGGGRHPISSTQHITQYFRAVPHDKATCTHFGQGASATAASQEVK